LSVRRMKSLSFVIFTFVFKLIAGEDYNFTTFEDIDLNEMEEVWKEDGEIMMTWTEAVQIMRLEEIETHKDSIKEKNNKIKELETEHNVKMKELAEKLKNKNILIKFLTTLLQKNENQYKVTREVIKTRTRS